MIRITSKKDGFRRCGISHPAKPTDYPADRFDADQLAALTAEPMLMVENLPDSEAKKTEKKETKTPAAGKADK